MTIDEVVETLLAAGWELLHDEAGERQLAHPSEVQLVTLVGDGSHTLEGDALEVARTGLVANPPDERVPAHRSEAAGNHQAYLPSAPGCVVAAADEAVLDEGIRRALELHLDAIAHQLERAATP